MSKLGYTFYPKDWQTSDRVFQLSLEERAIYREIIDLSYENDNQIEEKIEIWARKWNAKPKQISKGICKLLDLGLITREGDKITVPASEPRLTLVRAGRKGGEMSKPTPKPMPKPEHKPTPKGEANQKKIKEIEKKEKDESAGFAPPSFLSFLNFFTDNGYKKETAQKAFDYYEKRNWKDSHNNSVKDWQDKCRRLWFKDSEKDPDRKLTPEELAEYNNSLLAKLMSDYETGMTRIEKTIGDDTDD
jgi:hypothetical protein